MRSVALTRDQWTGLAAAAFATAYLGYVLAGLGSEFQAARQSRLAERVSLRHGAVCSRLGKPPASPDFEACMDALQDLKGWHERVFLEANESLL